MHMLTCKNLIINLVVHDQEICFLQEKSSLWNLIPYPEYGNQILVYTALKSSAEN